MLCFDCVSLSRRPGDGAVEQQAGVAVQSLGEKPAKQTAHLLGEEVRVKQEIREAECLVRWLTFVRTCHSTGTRKSATRRYEVMLMGQNRTDQTLQCKRK